MKKKNKHQQSCDPKILCCCAGFLIFSLLFYLSFPSNNNPQETAFHHPIIILESIHEKKENKGQDLINQNNHAKNRTQRSNFTESPIFNEPTGSADSRDKKRRATIREIFAHGFSGYAQFCYGKGDLRPLSYHCNSNGRDMPESPPMGFQLIANIDTFLLMGLHDFYDEARSWIETSLRWNVPIKVSVFETTIRCLGGLISAYQLTNDTLFLNRARELGNILIYAFNASSRIPYNKVTLDSSKPWGVNTNLAEAGTLSLEFASLSVITKDPSYAQKVLECYRSIIQFRSPETWLFSSNIRPTDVRHIVFEGDKAIGGGTDSFYEYLLKYSLLTKNNDKVMNEWWRHTADEIIEKHLRRINIEGIEMAYINPSDQPRHLECFLGGVFALAAINENDLVRKDIYKQVAEELGQFCRVLYTIREGTFKGLPVEAIRVRTMNGLTQLMILDASFRQRPEAVETWFYLWRLTKDQKYKDWAWDYAKALATVKVDYGYVSLESDEAVLDIQNSYFLSETLKYLFLIFSPDSVFPLDRYIFNTEAHPLLKFDPKSYYDLYIVSFPSLK